eukprot:scaffold20945_cov73-Skeletonema_marinoi.AAC.1
MEREEQFAKRNRPRIWEMSFERIHDQERTQYEIDIESKLLQKLLEEQAKLQYNDNDEVYVLTPLSLVPLFVQEQFGFIEEYVCEIVPEGGKLVSEAETAIKRYTSPYKCNILDGAYLRDEFHTI